MTLGQMKKLFSTTLFSAVKNLNLSKNIPKPTYTPLINAQKSMFHNFSGFSEKKQRMLEHLRNIENLEVEETRLRLQIKKMDPIDCILMSDCIAEEKERRKKLDLSGFPILEKQDPEIFMLNLRESLLKVMKNSFLFHSVKFAHNKIAQELVKTIFLKIKNAENEKDLYEKLFLMMQLLLIKNGMLPGNTTQIEAAAALLANAAKDALSNLKLKTGGPRL